MVHYIHETTSSTMVVTDGDNVTYKLPPTQLQMYLGTESLSTASVTIQSDSKVDVPDTHSTSDDTTTQDDGYRWRKYGQKQVKGCKYPRSYYRCTFPHCGRRKYVEKTDEGHEQVSYKGPEHSHTIQKSARFNEDRTNRQNVLTGQDLQSQREDGKPSLELNTTAIEGIITRPRLIIQTSVEIDDGHNWQPLRMSVKSFGLYQRDFFTCAHQGCVAKKIVEMREEVQKISYEGDHTHPLFDKKRKRESEVAL
ncbi:hypothetical protein PROFUN_14045 [Planoprotostelium fungivorum]|uniref:WRKY domain-containing protein n=1 Tax=Planoprotostelium fungivorum TaxID=1890364 RepID=A0A2P6N224_9EUKA|nr:hypothetical protein PROFUN_14045 [Planoprotostelium fungivorum]